MFSFFLTLFTFQNASPCISSFPLSRTGREACWIQVQVDHRNKVCLSHSLWIQWLSTPQPGALCPDPLERVQGVTRLVNSSPAPHPKSLTMVHFWTHLKQIEPI